MPGTSQAACQREFPGNRADHAPEEGGPGRFCLAWARGADQAAINPVAPVTPTAARFASSLSIP